MSAAVNRNNYREGLCLNNACNYCGGEAATHVYTYTFSDGESKSHCGAVALEIPNLTADDINEIKKLIREEHEYLIKHEAAK